MAKWRREVTTVPAVLQSVAQQVARSSHPENSLELFHYERF